MKDRFRVAVRADGVPPGYQLPPQLAVVIDLSVEDDPFRSVFISDRLAAAREIDDAQAAHPQRCAAIDHEADVVGPAVPDRVAHRVNEARVRGALAAREPYDAAHASASVGTGDGGAVGLPAIPSTASNNTRARSRRLNRDSVA